MSDNLESSLSNINLDFSNVNIEKTYEIPLSGNWGAIKISGNAKYQVACQYSQNGQIFISDTYGLTWKPVKYLTDNNLIGSFVGVGISDSGQYLSVIQRDGYIAISHDYGLKWSIIKISVNIVNSEYNILNMAKNWISLDISGTGQYQTAISYKDDINEGGYIYMSYNYGASWNDVTPYNSIISRFYYAVSISYSGKYQICVITAHELYDSYYKGAIVISNNYGFIWNDPIEIGNDLAVCCINSSEDLSIDGQFQYAADYSGDGIYASYDYGKTWNIVLSDNSPYMCIATSDDGKYIYCSTYSNYINFSNDYGQSWMSLNFNTTLSYISTSSDGSYIGLTTDSNKILFSNNYAETFVDYNDSPFLNNIYPVQISSSGQYQTSVISNYDIIISNNYGKTWIKKYMFNQWIGNSMSLTGQYQNAINLSNEIYLSNDYGGTWTFITKLDINSPFGGIKISGDGKYHTIVYANYNDPEIPSLYTSNDYGLTWNPIFIPDSLYLYGIAMSVSGKYQTVLDYFGLDFRGGKVYISNDYGSTFREYNIEEIYYWTDVSMSANGKFQLIFSYNKPFVYGISNDYGNNWTIYPQVRDDILSVNNCIVSSTGQYQFMSIYIKTFQYLIYYSIDYGNTWSILNTQTIKYSCQMASVSSTGQSIVLSNQNTIFEIYLKNLVK